MENIIHPVSGNILSIFSIEGRELLKSYLRNYKNGGGFDYSEWDTLNKIKNENENRWSYFDRNVDSLLEELNKLEGTDKIKKEDLIDYLQTIINKYNNIIKYKPPIGKEYIYYNFSKLGGH